MKRIGVVHKLLGYLSKFYLLLGMVACQSYKPALEPTLPMQTSPTTAWIGIVTQKPPSSPEPTAILSFVEDLGLETPLATSELPTPVADPLRFVFPTPGPAPVSAWRPPLYPTPWAPTPYDHFYFSRPIAADQVNWPSQNYRYGGEFFEDVVHSGVDIPAPRRTPVLATGAGKIVWAGYGIYRGGYDLTDPYGLAVVIRHDFGYQGQALFTIYGHLDQVDVVIGQHVEDGERIGLVGNTGFTTGPHLHFEIRLGENNFFETRNPELWMVPPQGWGILAGRIMDTSGNLVEKQPVIVSSKLTGQNWFGRSYGSAAVNSDPYYQENMVIGDLPAGAYLIRIDYVGIETVGEIEIVPGQVNYFYFYGRQGFVYEMPPIPGADFDPDIGQMTSTP